MEDYKSNSHKAREQGGKKAETPPKKVEKVVSGVTRVKKKKGIQKRNKRIGGIRLRRMICF